MEGLEDSSIQGLDSVFLLSFPGDTPAPWFQRLENRYMRSNVESLTPEAQEPVNNEHFELNVSGFQGGRVFRVFGFSLSSGLPGVSRDSGYQCSRVLVPRFSGFQGFQGLQGFKVFSVPRFQGSAPRTVKP